MINFKYWVEVEDGHKPVMETEEENEIEIIIEKNEIEIIIRAKCRVDAERMFKALMKPDNIIDIITSAED